MNFLYVVCLNMESIKPIKLRNLSLYHVHEIEKITRSAFAGRQSRFDEFKTLERDQYGIVEHYSVLLKNFCTVGNIQITTFHVTRDGEGHWSYDEISMGLYPSNNLRHIMNNYFNQGYLDAFEYFRNEYKKSIMSIAIMALNVFSGLYQLLPEIRQLIKQALLTSTNFR